MKLDNLAAPQHHTKTPILLVMGNTDCKNDAGFGFDMPLNPIGNSEDWRQLNTDGKYI